ncbi:DNA polymerase [Propionivibrio sp.]|uniref:DNA polymerase n=1 Tax=Propionivibrio sp. TaxID=2212460 RepID=UPI003BF227B0
MVAEQSFLIDATFLLNDAEMAFYGSTALVDDCARNTSVVYGAIRYLMKLRKILGIDCGVVVVGSDAYEITSALNIAMFCDLLLGIGSNVLNEPGVCVGSLCRSILLEDKAKWIVTCNKSLMQLVDARCGVILVHEGTTHQVITEQSLISHYHIRAEQVPSFLTLTDAGARQSLSTKQVVRLLEVHGTLNATLDTPVADAMSPKIRRYLTQNKATLLARLQELTVSDCIGSSLTVSIDPIVRNDEESRRLLKKFGFPSLGRLLASPPAVELVGITRDSSHAYVAVVDQVGLLELEKVVANAEFCAVDTESTGKDPRNASLLGVALAISKGLAFYVPVIQADLRDLSPASVFDVLRRLLGGKIKVVGHNLKYDYVLLRRHNIQIQAPYFDTMLAAYECFGDWDFFNLGAVAKKLIGHDVKRYRDIVDDGQTLQDLPFENVVEHGCADADATLRLFGHLSKILSDKKINNQFAEDVMPLMRMLGDKEIEGVCVDINAIVCRKDALKTEAEQAKASIFALAGKQFDVDSMMEITMLFREIEGLQARIGWQPLRRGQLEQLAQGNELARDVMHYRRLHKQVNQLLTILNGEKNGKVFPLFSQMKASHGCISSTDPSLFDLEEALPRDAVLDKEIRQLIPDQSRAMVILQQLTGDRVLAKDREEGKTEFINGEQPSLVGLSHEDVLISLAIGASNAALCKKFLIDARKASDLRKEVTGRYPQLFTWLEEYRRGIISSGFASSGGRRRYWDGLRSSDIDKRNRAQISAVRWLIGM